MDMMKNFAKHHTAYAPKADKKARQAVPSMWSQSAHRGDNMCWELDMNADKCLDGWVHCKKRN